MELGRLPEGVAHTRVASLRPTIVGARYELINLLAEGLMGSVHRALDRLTGHIVTLKHLRADSPSTPDSPWDSRGYRLLLAQEFRLLSSLRHPNIVSVLDYGFDDDRLPYFTMDLEEGGVPLTLAGAGQPLNVQVELLVQTLRAIAYLHRHGIIHRDLKPDNIIVVGSQVKVLDFGLSTSRQAVARNEAGWGGTVSYMAPEVLRGEPPSERCDLYSFGMVALELLSWSQAQDSSPDLPSAVDILNTPLPRPTDVLDSRLRPILERLLSKSPNDRYTDASEVIGAFAAALEQPFSPETVATRESFLQSAPLVGRDEELAALTQLVRSMRKGSGSTWLVAGESGVGKSRLLEEVRTRALVDGVLVARGQAVSHGGGPYRVWRDIVCSLLLRVEAPDQDVEVLKAIVPDVGTLTGRTVPDAVTLEVDAAQLRLLVVLENLIRRQPGPVLMILEDLQWAGSESLKLLRGLALAISDVPAVLLGSYRDDEAPHLDEAVGPANVFRLRRLDAPATAALVEAMVGPGEHREELIDLLEHETEGIPFFIVEVVRALAEAEGGLAQIGRTSLPRRVISGGMEKVLHRRLHRASPGALQTLATAAVIGRTIDAELLRAIHPDVDLDRWLTDCIDVALLEVHEQRWRFAHDKLRDQLLEDLSPAQRRELHRTVGTVIERDCATRPEWIPALAYHWRWANDPAKEATYAYQAGVLTLQSGACQEAIEHLSRALELLSASQAAEPYRRPRRRRRTLRALLDPNAGIDPDSRAFRLGMVESWLTEAHFRVGDLAACTRYAESALCHLGRPVPSRQIGWVLGTARAAVLRLLQASFGRGAVDPVTSQRVATEIARVQGRLIEASFYSLRAMPIVWGMLHLMNHSQPAGPEMELAHGYMIFIHLADLLPGTSIADAAVGRILEIAERAGTPHDVAWCLSRIAVSYMGRCRWTEAEAGLTRAIETAQDLGDPRLWAECHSQLGSVALHRGQLERARQRYRDAEGLSRRSGNRQIESWALFGQADALLRLGRHEEALPLYREGIDKLDLKAMHTEAISGFGMSALAHLRAGDRDAAYESADRALSLIVRSPPVAYWTQQGIAATAEVFLTLLEATRDSDPRGRSRLVPRAQSACAGLRRYARRFPLGRPHAALWLGTWASLSGRRRRAMRLWRRAIETATRLDTPYERGRAHLEIARTSPPETVARGHHLREAIDIFNRLGAAADLARAQAELAVSSGSSA